MNTELDLRSRLARAAETVTPKPPVPVDVIERDARRDRSRRRRGWAAVGSAALLVGATITGVVWQTSDDGHAPAPPAGPVDPCAGMVTATGTRPNASTEGQGSVVVGDIFFVRGDCSTDLAVGGPTFDYQPALSHDGKRIAFVRRLPEGAGTALMLLDTGTGDTRQLAQTTDALGTPEFSPDDGIIAFWLNTGDGYPSIYTVPVAGGEAARLTSGGVVEFMPSWSSDGERIAFVRGDELVVHEIATGAETVLDQAPAGLRVPFWADDDGQALMAIRQRGLGSHNKGVSYEIYLLDPRTGEVLSRSEVFDGFVYDAVHDGDGIRVVVSGMLGGELVGQSQVVEYDDDFNEVRRSEPIIGDAVLTARLAPTPIGGS